MLTDDSKVLCINPADGQIVDEVPGSDSSQLVRIQGVEAVVRGPQKVIQDLEISLIAIDDKNQILSYTDNQWQSDLFAPLNGLDADQISRVTVSPHGGRVACPSGEEFVLRGAASGTEILSVDGKHGMIRSLAFGPDGRSVLAGDSAGNLLLWLEENID